MKRQNVRRLILLVSMLIFPVTMYFFSPMNAVEGAAKGIIAGSLLVFLAMFVSSLVLGRLWCGWICPGGGLQEMCAGINNKRVNWKKSDTVKFILWTPWIAAVIIAGINAGRPKKIEMLHGVAGLFTLEGKTFVMYYVLMALIAGLAIAAGRRAFCHYVCWMSPFMIIGSRIREFFGWRAVRLRANPTLCNGCGVCNKYCPMGLDVRKLAASESMYNDECILCGECVDRCAKKAIKFSFEPGPKELTVKIEEKEQATGMPEVQPD